MDRRSVLKGLGAVGVGAAAGPLAAPAIAQGVKTIKFVPQANLANFDPIWGTQYVVRNASQLVWDMLYGMNAKLEPQRQMVESEQVSSDGLTWTFKLREGLKFHDGEPVRAKDCVASIERWSQRDGMGLMLRAIQKELTAVDDRTFKWVLSKPYPKMLMALGKIGTPICFIMPERIAKTDPFKQIDDYVGSGPMKFVKGDWKPGATAAFERNKDYVSRSEASDWFAGAKNMLVDRVEWVIMPDPATASAALQNGEVDWWENPIPDLVPVLKRNRNIKIDIADPLGNIGSFRLNHMHPPFDNIKVRQAVQAAISQEDYMRAIVGSEDALWKPCPCVFTPTSYMYTEVGGEALKKPDLEKAKRLLKESGYAGQPVVCVVAQDQPITKAMGEITADVLKKIGMTVDFVATDWGTVGQRRASKSPPGQGGWGMFHTWHAGVDTATPVGNIGIRANGDKAWFGWPQNDQIEADIASWYEAKTIEEEKKIAEKINRGSMEHVSYIPTGFFLGYQGWRTSLEGVRSGPLPWFWGVKKA
ncbi:MAG: ABC transporter substrate-binding protein [Methylobacteriaceae bacterium]|nr:ABC transporter substrate-binding protein [Methylobacteriaceae bacterium]